MNSISRLERIEQLSLYLLSSILVALDYVHDGNRLLFASISVLLVCLFVAIKKPFIAARISFVALAAIMIFYGYYFYRYTKQYFFQSLEIIWTIQYDDLLGGFWFYVLRIVIVSLTLVVSAWVLKRQASELPDQTRISDFIDTVLKVKL